MARRENGARPIRRTRPRTCVGCGTESPKKGLIRVVRKPDGEVSIDPTGKAPGRGAYLCASADCLREAKKRKALSRCLKVVIPESLYDELESYIANLPERKD
ncbi:MAG: YlxR family protein [Synergistaceae bacterium]|nr:YlxR family protein [Synergistaceae bacterium]